LNYFTKQGGKSDDPNLGRDPLFADPWRYKANENIMRPGFLCTF